MSIAAGAGIDGEDWARVHGPDLRGVVRRQLTARPDLVDDALQEAYISASGSIGRLLERERVGGWLAVVARRSSIAVLRREERASRPCLPPAERSTPAAEDEALMIEDSRAAARALDAALQALTPRHRRVVVALLNGASHAELAAAEELSPESVRALVHRARASFRRAYDHAAGPGAMAAAPLATPLRRWLRRLRRVRLAPAAACAAVLTLAPLGPLAPAWPTGGPGAAHAPSRSDREGGPAGGPAPAQAAGRSAGPAPAGGGRVATRQAPPGGALVAVAVGRRGVWAQNDLPTPGRTTGQAGVTVACDAGAVARAQCAVLGAASSVSSNPSAEAPEDKPSTPRPLGP